MNRGETAVALFLVVGNILLLAMLFSPLLVVHLHYKAKRKRRAMLQLEYDDAISDLRRCIENYLSEGMTVAGEIWDLPEDNVMGGLFFDVLKDSAAKLNQTVHFPKEKEITPNTITELRWREFRQAGLLMEASSKQDCWIINLVPKRESREHVINLKDMMETVLKLHSEIVLTRC
jgi:urease gamma subunit